MRVSKLILSATVLLIGVCVSSCQKPVKSGETDDTRIRLGAPIAKGTEEPPTVLFDLEPDSSHPDSSGAKLYNCSYHARGKTAKFQIQLRYGALHGDIPMALAEGKFISIPGSENTSLIDDLRVALEAKQLPAGVKRIPDLPFNAVVLGEKLSRDPEGRLSSKPAGDWISTKIFLPKGGDDGEVFLHLNPVLGKGEFAIKDSDYGDFVLRELAKVL